MARIAEDLIARLKSEVPVERVVAAAGVELIRRGKDLVGRCPFHQPDEEPSLVVTPAKRLWRCFGCNKGGTVIDWRMEISGESFRAAVESLATEHLPGAQLEQAAVPALEPFAGEELERWLEASDEETLQLSARYYHDQLDVDLRGREYLGKRGLSHPELPARFLVGFADRSLGLRVPVKQVKAGEALRGKLMRLGVLREESGHEHLNGSLVVPIRTLDGQVVQMYGRKVTSRLRPGTPVHLYLPGSLDRVFNPEALVESDELILCESILDALTFWCAGFRHTTCSFGVHNFPASLLTSMLEHGTRRVLVAYDRDDQGDTAAAAVAEKLLAAGIECHRVLFPRGMDANEYALKVQPASKSLDLVLRKAEWMGKGPAPSVVVPELLEVGENRGAAPPLAASASAAAAAPLAPPPSSLLPAAPAIDVPAEVHGQELTIELDDRRYRVRGLEKNLAFDVLRINLLAARGEAFHIDTLDLYSARQRGAFLKQAALELGLDVEVMKRDLGKIRLKLEELQEQQIRRALEPKEKQVVLSDAERDEALSLLRAPHLVERILGDFEQCGVVGEETNKR